MSPIEIFYESRIHRTNHRVLGYRLRPLCLLDIVALEAIGSPFMRGTAGATGVDLGLAARLLSRPTGQNLSVDPNILRPSKSLFLRLHLYDLVTELKKFEAYLADYFTPVSLWRNDGSGSSTPLGCPWAQSLATFLSRETSMSQREIWASPIGHILWQAAALEEQISDSRIKTEHDETLEADAENCAAELATLKAKEIASLEDQLTAGTISADGLGRLNQLKGI